ncbi:MAG: phosphoribosylaminoimidazolesuccinocarboxamide synthase [Bacteroidota bacterium]
MSNTITTTNFNFPNQKSVYRGKVREVYNINDELLVMVATDRLSAFDVVLPKGIPYKGQILNQIATKFMELTQDIVPNWLIATPDPSVAVGHLCDPFKVEMVIRGYVSGHAAREYAAGRRQICGVTMAEDLKENDKFPEPIITPTTKADNGSHDEDISREDILSKGIVTEEDYLVLEKYTRDLFQRGTEIAASRGLILVDTKYEFGKTKNGVIVLIDEIHTPDSSRYFYAEGYQERQNNGEEQKGDLPVEIELVYEKIGNQKSNYIANTSIRPPKSYLVTLLIGIVISADYGATNLVCSQMKKAEP